MNALNPLSSDKRDGDRKAYEPSMEEILASIRRIIADDQAFATRPTPAPQARSEPKPLAEPVLPLVAEPEALALRGRNPPKESGAKPTVSRETIALGPTTETQPPEPGAAATAASVPPSAPAFPVEAQFHFFKSTGVPATAEPSAPEPRQIEQAGRKPDAVGAAKETVWPAPPPPPERVLGHQPVRTAAPAIEKTPGEELPLVSPETDAAVASAFNTLIASRFLPSDDVLTDMIKEMMRPMLKTWLDDNLPVLVERLVRAEIERVARGGR